MDLITNRGDIFREVRSRVNIVDVASRLQINLTKQGSDLIGECPVGHASKSKKSFHIVTSHREPYFHCFNCGKGGDAVRLVSITKNINDLDAAKWLINEFNLKIDPNHLLHNKPTPAQIKEKEELISRSTVLEKIYELGKEKLYQDEGKAALDYLVNVRGYDKEILKNTDWFYLPKKSEIKKELLSQFPEMKDSLDKIKLNGYYGDNFRLAFPYSNADGYITGFMKRSTDAKGMDIKTFDGKEHSNVRWDSTPKLKKNDLFGLDKVDHKEDTLIVVEGYPDAIYLQASGMSNIVAVGQGRLTSSHLVELRRRKIKNLIIAFDNDEVGPKNTHDAVELILKNGSITPYVLDPAQYGDNLKDPDEYFKKHGYGMLDNLFQSKPEDGVLWVVKKLLSGFDKLNKLKKNQLKNDVLQLQTLVKDEGTVSEVFAMLKDKFGDSIASLKTQLKRKKKSYDDELAEHIENDPIIPLNDKNSNSKCYYDPASDVLNIKIERDFINELMLDCGLTPPEIYPSFTVKFDPQDLGGKFNLYHRTFNLFTPTEYMLLEKNSDTIELSKDCPAIFTVLSNVVPEKKERESFINWLSYIFSSRRKSIVAWLIRGTQGSGKNLLFERIITPLWGDNQCITVGNNALDSDFNSYIKNKMMIAYNEVTTNYKSDKKEKESKIKTYVSDDKVRINEKQIREYTLDNFSNSLFFSNYEVPIIIEDGDRRFNVVENFVKLENHSNYKKFSSHQNFLDQIESELMTFAQYLMNYSYDIQLANRVFMNSAKEKIVGSSMSIFEEFAKKLKAGDHKWLSEESGVLSKKSWNLKCVEQKYILKDAAIEVFNRLYGKKLTSPNVLSKQLQHYGINKDGKVTINGKRISSVYTW
ncbi:MAG: toprim domain-containing protein [Ignavibacteriae bacterium]|nr:toprim domain-containing protein [Ignavibacteriota bacterium]NOH00382.1 toprim domain-containing protein [Ignavibacteriota bacterium]